MKTIAFYNQKGGVGKTASADTISHILATVYKQKTLIIDLDAQANTSMFYGNINVGEYLSASLRGEAPDKGKVGFTLEDLLLDRDLDIHKTIQHTNYGNLDIIPTFLTLSACENRLQSDVRSPQQLRLKQHCQAIQDEYDYCILDCSPSVNLVNINGLAMTDRVYVPMKCDAYSACGMTTIKQLISEVSEFNPKIQLGGIFFTQWGNKRVDRSVLEFLNAFIPEEILDIKIPKSTLMEEISFEQKPLYSYDKGHKHRLSGIFEYSKVTQAYLKLADYIYKH